MAHAERMCPVDGCRESTISTSSSYLCATRMIRHIEIAHGSDHVPESLAEYAKKRYNVEDRDHNRRRELDYVGHTQATGT